MLKLKVFNNANSVVYTEERSSNKVTDLVRLQKIGVQKLSNIPQTGLDIDSINISRFEIENNGNKIFEKYLD